MKECFKCGETKDFSEFYKHKGMSDGYIGKCKGCNKADVRANRAKKIDYYREYDKSRANNPERVEARRVYAASEGGLECHRLSRKAWQERNAIKRAASIMVGNAVRDGKLFKPDSCESCLVVPDRLHGHHDDYAYPLIVRWLCPKCHSDWHKENGEGLNG